MYLLLVYLIFLNSHTALYKEEQPKFEVCPLASQIEF